MIDAPPPQIAFTLGNPDAPNTVYISSDPQANALTLQLIPNADVAVTPATPVAQGQAGSASGTLLYLDLSALKINAADFAKFALANSDWLSAPFADDGQICIAPKTASTLRAGNVVSFELTGFVLPKAPNSGSAALKLDCYHAAPVARGSFPAVSNSQVAVTPPPAGQDDLREALSAAILPQAIALSDGKTPAVSNRLTLTLSPVAGGLSAQAGDQTVFTLSVVYASDAYGYGALMTPAQGANISIPVPEGGGWTPTNVDGLQGRSWQLVPDSGATLPSASGGAVSFDIEPIVSSFQPGPTMLLLSYTGVPGFADGAFAMTLIKEPHVCIESFTATPALATLEQQHASVTLNWQVTNAGLLMLDPVHVDVTGKTHFEATIRDTTTFTLTAYGSGSGDVDNVAIANATTTVIPVLNAFEAAPGAVSVDDFGGGNANVALRWSVNAPKGSDLQLSSSATGPLATQFGALGTIPLEITQPQMFTLGVAGDARPQDMWRLYIPAFTLQAGRASGGGGAYAAAAPGASYVAVAQEASNDLAILSTASYTKIATVSCGSHPQGLCFAPDGDTIYVANAGDGTVSVISVTASSTSTPPWSFAAGTPINVGGSPAKVALAPAKYLYATVGASSGPGSLAMVTLADGTINSVLVGNDPYGLAVTPSGAQIFVANRGDGTVSQIGISPRGAPQLIRTLADLPGAAGLAVTPDGNTLLVACSDGTVQLLDAIAPDTSPRTAVQVGGLPMEIALDPSGAYALVSDHQGGRLALISIAKQTVLGTPLTLPAAQPMGVSVSPDGTLVLVGHASALSVISLQTYLLRSDPPNCGGFVTEVAVSADGKSAFTWADASVTVKNAAPANGLHVYDVASETLLSALPGVAIIGLAVAPAAANAGFLTQKGESALYPFDTSAFALGTPIAIPAKGGFTSRQPLAVAVADDASRVFVLVADGQNQFSIAVFTNGDDGYALSDDVTVYTAMATPIEPRLAAAPDGSAAYAYDGTNGNLWSISLSGGAFVLGTPLSFGIAIAAAILVSPDGSTLYVAGQQQLSTAFFVVDCKAWTFERRALTEPVTMLSVHGMALSPDGTRIVITDPTGGTIRFIDARSIRFLQTIADPGSFKAPTGVRMSPDQSRLFVGDMSGLFASAIQVRPAGATATAE